MYNPNAFSSENDRKYRNWDGPSLIHTFDCIKTLETLCDLNEFTWIWDLGSRDACQALELSDWFPGVDIAVFEPLPSSAEWCRNVAKVRCDMDFYELAISDTTGPQTFIHNPYNIGASSLLHKRGSENYKRITVEGITGKDFIDRERRKPPDFIWMDVQGAERQVLSSFGSCLNDIKAIHTEVGIKPVYDGAINYKELIYFMGQQGFNPIKIYTNSSNLEVDVLFFNRRYLD